MPAHSSFFGEEADANRLLAMTARNHRSYFAFKTRALGGSTLRSGNLIWRAHRQEKGDAVLAFPDGASTTLSRDLDSMLAECRRRSFEGASAWALTTDDPHHLGARLLARGFEWGWRPHWMALDTMKMNEEITIPDGLKIGIVSDEGDWARDAPENLPYHDIECAEIGLTKRFEEKTLHFGAWLNGRIAGHASILLTNGPLGCGGIYNVGVVPELQNQGIGKAVVHAACRYAKSRGCRYVTLNAASEWAYRKVGFETVGFGQTWWMHRPILEAPPPAESQIRFVEALGSGEIETLEALGLEAVSSDADAISPCGMTPLQVSVQTNQSASAEWLLQRGATPDLVSVWDLGWRDRAPEFLAKFPNLANRRIESNGGTPLHEAVIRRDGDFVRWLLDLGADPNLRDRDFNSDPAGWARHFRYEDILKLFNATS